MVNWTEVIDSLIDQQGVAITTDPARWDISNPEYSKILKQWTDANFNLNTIKWINYYPGLHYSQDIVDSVAEDLEIKVHRSWISRIDPGYMAPWHWDVDDKEPEYLKHGPIIRYTVIPKDFANGHIFILGKKYHYDLPQGITIQWDNHREWHSGINAGLEPNWMFHILGY